VDNLSDRDDQKVDRMRVRFTRVRRFLQYLRQEEERERIVFNLNEAAGIWQEAFTPSIIEQIEREVGWIERRLQENRERYEEDVEVAIPYDPEGLLDLDPDETETVEDEQGPS